MSETAARVVALITQLQQTAGSRDKERVFAFQQLGELLIHREPELLDNFLEEVLQFHLDGDSDVRTALFAFVEAIAKSHPKFLPYVIQSVLFMIRADHATAADLKRCFQAMTVIYGRALFFLCGCTSAASLTEAVRSMWTLLQQIVQDITSFLPSSTSVTRASAVRSNEGVRTWAIKFIEKVVLIYSIRTSQSEPPQTKPSEDEVSSLDTFPLTHLLLDAQQLRLEGIRLFDLLAASTLVPTVSASALMVLCSSLASIARQRPTFIQRACISLSALTSESALPVAIGQGSIASVKKKLRSEIISLMKHPSSTDFHTELATGLNNLGAKRADYEEFFRDTGAQRKRAHEEEANSQTAKKPRVTVDPSILARIPLETVAELVLQFLPQLPDIPPPDWLHPNESNSAAPAAPAAPAVTRDPRLARRDPRIKQEPASTNLSNERVVAPLKPEMDIDQPAVDPFPQTVATISASTALATPQAAPAPVSSRRPYELNPLPSTNNSEMLQLTFQRLLESSALNVGAPRASLLARLVSQSRVIFGDGDLLGANLTEEYFAYLAMDMSANFDLILVWLYQEHKIDAEHYQSLFLRFMDALQPRLGPLKREEKTDRLFARLLLEAPDISELCFDKLHNLCEDAETTQLGLMTLAELICDRPVYRDTCFAKFEEFLSSPNDALRLPAIMKLRNLFESRPGTIADTIRNTVVHGLNGLQDVAEFPEFDVRVALDPYLSLCQVDPTLLHALAIVYSVTSTSTKRIILVQLSSTIRILGQECTQVLDLITNYPKGAELLVLKILHILTEKAAPTKQLGDCVRNIYANRLQDARLLIPVLPTLEKQEIFGHLPKLIGLAKSAVHEMFSRLFTSVPQVNPADVMIALHSVDPARVSSDSKEAWKFILEATSICFEFKTVYTQEVLATVLHQLVELNPLPILLMRTVMLSLQLCPRLINRVVAVLLRLISKKIWEKPKLWEGFLKCCVLNAVQAVPVLLQLPAKPFAKALETHGELRQALLQHCQSLSETQLSQQIPVHVQTALGLAAPGSISEEPHVVEPVA